MKIKVVIGVDLERVFECESLDNCTDQDGGLHLYREGGRVGLIAVVPRYLYWEDVTEVVTASILGVRTMKLNPLGWVDHDVSCEAVTAIGRWTVFRLDSKFYWRRNSMDTFQMCGSIDHGKALCHQDYKRLVLSVIDVNDGQVS